MCEGTGAVQKSTWWLVLCLGGGELLPLCDGHGWMQSRPRRSLLVTEQQTMMGGDRYNCSNANIEGGMDVCATTKWALTPRPHVCGAVGYTR